MKKTTSLKKAMNNLFIFLLKLGVFFGLFIGFIVYMARDKPIETKKQVIVLESSDKLKACTREILEKNRSMMEGQAVGNWNMLNDIKAEAIGDRIDITYYVNSQFSNEKRKGLDTMQKIFSKNAGCSSSVIHTMAE